MAFDLKSYENQARLSVALAVLAMVAIAGAAILILPQYKPEFGIAVRAGRRFYLILAALGAAFTLSIIGFAFGFHSAGQKRNKMSGLSWAGFFMNAGAITLALSVFVFFWLVKFVVS